MRYTWNYFPSSSFQCSEDSGDHNGGEVQSMKVISNPMISTTTANKTNGTTNDLEQQHFMKKGSFGGDSSATAADAAREDDLNGGEEVPVAGEQGEQKSR